MGVQGSYLIAITGQSTILIVCQSVFVANSPILMSPKCTTSTVCSCLCTVHGKFLCGKTLAFSSQFSYKYSEITEELLVDLAKFSEPFTSLVMICQNFPLQNFSTFWENRPSLRICISRNTNLKYLMHCTSLVVQYSHARYLV